MKRVLFIALIFIQTIVFSQQTFKGKIVDAITKEPLEMASIKDSASGEITFSDKDGMFSLHKKNGNTFFIS